MQSGMALFSDVHTQKKKREHSLQLVYTTEQKVSVDCSIHLRQENKDNTNNLRMVMHLNLR